MSEPDITVQAVHVGGSNGPVGRVVIHTTSPGRWSFPETSQPPSAHGTALYFTQQASGGSAHYIEDTETEEHCVTDDRQAWHAPPNIHSIGIEICGHPDYTREQWLDLQVWPAVLRAAWRTNELCQRFTIPMVKVDAADLLNGALGICGHVDVTEAWHQTDHTDPGDNFPWPEFIAAVRGTYTGVPAPPATPEDDMFDQPDREHLNNVTETVNNTQDAVGRIETMVYAIAHATGGANTTDAGLIELIKGLPDKTVAAIKAAL